MSGVGIGRQRHFGKGSLTGILFPEDYNGLLVTREASLPFPNTAKVGGGVSLPNPFRPADSSRLSQTGKSAPADRPD